MAVMMKKSDDFFIISFLFSTFARKQSKGLSRRAKVNNIEYDIQ